MDTPTQWPAVDEAALRKLREKSLAVTCFDLLVAALLPYKERKIDWTSFKKVLDQIIEAGGIPVINADTGWIFLLSQEEKLAVVKQVLEWYPDQQFVVGITIDPATESNPEAVAAAYNAEMDRYRLSENIRFMVMQSKPLTQLRGEQLVAAYAGMQLEDGIMHELEEAFAPGVARVYEVGEFAGIIQLEQFTAGKISELTGPAYLQRLLLVSEMELDFKEYSGNDWRVFEALYYGCGILMGAACLFTDLYRKTIDARTGDYCQFQDMARALEFLADFNFGANPGEKEVYVGCYRGFHAQVLYLLGVISSPELHPRAPQRDVAEWMNETIFDLLRKRINRVFGE